MTDHHQPFTRSAPHELVPGGRGTDTRAQEHTATSCPIQRCHRRSKLPALPPCGEVMLTGGAND